MQRKAEVMTIQISDSFLGGGDFSPGFRVTVEPGKFNIRDARIEELVRGKRVVDVGFLDSGSIEDKVSSGAWLHMKVRNSSARAIGVDVDGSGIDQVKEMCEIDALCADLSSTTPRELVEFRPEIVLCADVIEHVPDPLAFLRGVVKLAAICESQVVVSVPNYAALPSVRGVLRNEERVNSDHRFYFSPFTISKLMWDAGLRAQTLELVASYEGRPNLAPKIRRFLLRRFPLLRDTCLVVADVR